MNILRLALMVAALAACAPSLVGLGEIPDAPTRETSGSDSAPAEDAGRADVAPTPSDATDGAVAPDAAPAVDASSPTAADAGDAAEVSVDVAPVADTSDANDAPRGDVDPCGGACANRPHTTMSECHATGACLVWCANGWGDCDRLGSNGCETDLNARDNCGSCGIPCGSARLCFRGGCRPP